MFLCANILQGHDVGVGDCQLNQTQGQLPCHYGGWPFWTSTTYRAPQGGATARGGTTTHWGVADFTSPKQFNKVEIYGIIFAVG